MGLLGSPSDPHEVPIGARNPPECIAYHFKGCLLLKLLVKPLFMPTAHLALLQRDPACQNKNKRHNNDTKNCIAFAKIVAMQPLTFFLKASLTDHINEAHKIKNHKCEECGFAANAGNVLYVTSVAMLLPAKAT